MKSIKVKHRCHVTCANSTYIESITHILYLYDIYIIKYILYYIYDGEPERRRTVNDITPNCLCIIYISSPNRETEYEFISRLHFSITRRYCPWYIFILNYTFFKTICNGLVKPNLTYHGCRYRVGMSWWGGAIGRVRHNKVYHCIIHTALTTPCASASLTVTSTLLLQD